MLARQYILRVSTGVLAHAGPDLRLWGALGRIYLGATWAAKRIFLGGIGVLATAYIIYFCVSTGVTVSYGVGTS